MTTIDVDADAPQGESTRLQRLSDALNPILLKEVRQAMRGRYFKYSFWFTLTVATLVGLSVLLVTMMNGDEDMLGPAFFIAIFACLALAAHVLVPFSAFLSMGGEWDENTWDLLVLSNLKPRQIVLGKVLSAGVQALLYYSAFGPFLVFAFLLRGVDVNIVLVTLAVSFVVSLLLSCLATAMSSLSRGRFARVVLMVLLAVVLVWAAGGTVGWAATMVMQPGLMHDGEVQDAILGTLTIGLAVSSFFFAAATARLAHEEENRSTGLRLTALVVLLVGLGWMMWTFWDSRQDDPMVAGAVLGFSVLGAASLLFATESERLGRRVEVTLPKSRLVAWLATPLYPGGARGLLFFIAGGLLITGWMYLFDFLNGSADLERGEQLVPLVLLGYGIVFIGLPSGIFSWQSDSVGIRIAARISILVFFIASILLPALLGFLIGMDQWAEFEHPGNVFMVIDDLWSDRNVFGPYVFVLLFGVLLTLLVNAPRLKKLVVETRRATALSAKERG